MKRQSNEPLVYQDGKKEILDVFEIRGDDSYEAQIVADIIEQFRLSTAEPKRSEPLSKHHAHLLSPQEDLGEISLVLISEDDLSLVQIVTTIGPFFVRHH